MELNEYQKQAMTTCTESSKNPLYMLFNLQGEVGELSGKIAKLIRKDKVSFNIGVELINDGGGIKRHSTTNYAATADEMADLRKEAGDVLWQLSGLCTVMGWSLAEVAQENLDKLASRKERGVIVGDGDNR